MTFDVPTQVTFDLNAACPNHGRTDLGCTNVILNMLAEEKSLRIDDLSMALTVDMDITETRDIRPL